MASLVDTSAIVALLNGKDENHEKARAILEEQEEREARLLLTNFVLAETYGLVAIRLSHRVARAWLERNTLPVERVQDTDEEEAREILLTHDDKSFSYVDATSFALMERLDLETAFTFDPDFQRFGFTPLRPP